MTVEIRQIQAIDAVQHIDVSLNDVLWLFSRKVATENVHVYINPLSVVAVVLLYEPDFTDIRLSLKEGPNHLIKPDGHVLVRNKKHLATARLFKCPQAVDDVPQTTAVFY